MSLYESIISIFQSFGTHYGELASVIFSRVSRYSVGKMIGSDFALAIFEQTLDFSWEFAFWFHS